MEGELLERALTPGADRRPRFLVWLVHGRNRRLNPAIFSCALIPYTR
jgi:hypothetical protein